MSAQEMAGQAVSDIFTGVSAGSARSRQVTEKGITSAAVPAFVAGEELADLADIDPRVVVMTADLATANRLIDFKPRHPERSGSEVHPALGAAELLAGQGLSVRVVDMHTISPLDTDAIVAAARETGAILTVEEHNIAAGLGGAVAEVLAERRLAVPFRRHGVPNEYVRIGPPAALYAHYRLDAAGIAAEVRALCDTARAS